MSKSKNHTNHNQNYKAHRNGIKTMKAIDRKSTKGMCPAYRRQVKHCRKLQMIENKVKAAERKAAKTALCQQKEAERLKALAA